MVELWIDTPIICVAHYTSISHFPFSVQQNSIFLLRFAPLCKHISLCSYFRFIHRLIKRLFFLFVVLHAYTHTRPPMPHATFQNVQNQILLKRSQNSPYLKNRKRFRFIVSFTENIFYVKTKKEMNEKKNWGKTLLVQHKCREKKQKKKTKTYSVEKSPQRLNCSIPRNNRTLKVPTDGIKSIHSKVLNIVSNKLGVLYSVFVKAFRIQYENSVICSTVTIYLCVFDFRGHILFHFTIEVLRPELIYADVWTLFVLKCYAHMFYVEEFVYWCTHRHYEQWRRLTTKYSWGTHSDALKHWTIFWTKKQEHILGNFDRNA